MAFAHSSVIVTGAAVDTRTRDQLSFVFNARPQSLTLYVSCIILNDDVASGSNRAIIQIGSSNSTNPRLVLDAISSTWRWIILNEISNSVQSTVSTSGLTVGDRYEFRGVVNSNGSVQLGVVRNGGAESLGSASGALTLTTAWTLPIIWFNSIGTVSTYFAAYRNVHIMAGVKTMQEMRRLAGVE